MNHKNINHISTTDQRPIKIWEQRIVDGARDKLERIVLNAVDALNLDEKTKQEALEAIDAKLNDDEFIQSSSKMGNWEQKLANAEDPEKEGDELSNGLIFKIKTGLRNEGSNKIFG